MDWSYHFNPLPRFANRGLIEADLASGRASSRLNFPDSRIGASLKLGSLSARLSSRGDFPDSRIGASLKLDGLLRLSLASVDTSPIRESGPH